VCKALEDEMCHTPSGAPRDNHTARHPSPSVKLMDHTRRALFAEMTAQGITDATVQREAMSNVLGRVVKSRATLTEDEGHTLLDSLRARRIRAEADAIIDGTDR
jgi:hypothetical protein